MDGHHSDPALWKYSIFCASHTLEVQYPAEWNVVKVTVSYSADRGPRILVRPIPQSHGTHGTISNACLHLLHVEFPTSINLNSLNGMNAAYLDTVPQRSVLIHSKSNETAEHKQLKNYFINQL
jgi:hypothetical protein